MFRHRSAFFRKPSLLSAFFGQYTEYTNIHGVSNIKLLHSHSFTYQCHSTGIVKYYFKTMDAWDRMHTETSDRHIFSTIPNGISRPGTATPTYQWMRNKLSLADDNIVTQ